MITKGSKVNFYYTSKGTTDGTDSSGILFDGQNLEIHTHGKVFKGTDTNTWRNLLVDSSAKATNDTSSGGINIVSGDDIAIEWLEPGQGSGYSGSADWSSLRISTSGLDDMAMLSPDDSCTYGADTSHGGSSTFNRFAQSWRPIKIDNEDLLDLDSSAPLNLLAGEGIELDASGSNVYINFSGDVENGAYLLEDDGSAIIPGFDAENNTVHLTPQTLTSGQMQQARSNIGALSTDSLTGYATEIWVGEQGYVTDVSYLESKIGIVASSSATVNAEVGKYYRYDEAINSLTVNLPSVTEATTLQKIMIYFQAGASNALTLSSTDDIQYMNGYDIESGSTYEVTIMWNGYSWIVTLMDFGFGGVDLGLPSGTIWAKCNVGAKNPWEYGLYFSWGNVEGHLPGDGYNFTPQTHSNTLGYSLSSDIPYNSSTYDAVTANMRYPWHMPSKEELEELVNYTDSIWISNYIGNISGRKFMKKTDHSTYIFIPAAGYINGISFLNEGVWDLRYSRNLYNNTGCYRIDAGQNSIEVKTDPYRHYGFPCRGCR